MVFKHLLLCRARLFKNDEKNISENSITLKIVSMLKLLLKGITRKNLMRR